MAKKIILSVNAGSSSVKISVYQGEQNEAPSQLAEAQVNGLTAPPAKLDYSRGGTTVTKGQEIKGETKIASQDDAFELILKTLIDDESLPEIRGRDSIAIVCHRIVHGGDFPRAQVISQETYYRLEALSDLAPLHNAASLAIVRSCVRELPTATNVAYFDSQFHASLPEHVRTYPIDQEIARKNGLRKYGFHGISYAFITRSTAEFLGKKPSELNLIALHLGSGASACAVKGGKSWDTSMGLTPLAGLPGATRSGSVDPRYESCCCFFLLATLFPSPSPFPSPVFTFPPSFFLPILCSRLFLLSFSSHPPPPPSSAAVALFYMAYLLTLSVCLPT